VRSGKEENKHLFVGKSAGNNEHQKTESLFKNGIFFSHGEK